MKFYKKHASLLDTFKSKSTGRINMIYSTYTGSLSKNWNVFFFLQNLRNIGFKANMTDLKSSYLPLASNMYNEGFVPVLHALCDTLKVFFSHFSHSSFHTLTLLLFLGCGYGWLKYNTHCYFYDTRQLTWNESKV
jgi:hypothetical protein